MTNATTTVDTGTNGMSFKTMLLLGVVTVLSLACLVYASGLLPVFNSLVDVQIEKASPMLTSITESVQPVADWTKATFAELVEMVRGGGVAEEISQ